MLFLLGIVNELFEHLSKGGVNFNGNINDNIPTYFKIIILNI